MKIAHWMKREQSGLARSTLELAVYEEKQGHDVSVREPSGAMLHGANGSPDIHCIHSQIPIETYHDGKPKIMWMHGEPLMSVANGISMRAIVDLSSVCEAFICMRKREYAVWNIIKRTYLVPKGIDLEIYKPLSVSEIGEKLSGEPAILYVENWRGTRNPLYLVIAMVEVVKKFPKARLHLFNCANKKMYDTFRVLIQQAKLWSFVRTLNGPVSNANLLYNRADIVVSCLYPLYARGIEALGAGKAFIGPGYDEDGYPWTCSLQPESIADVIVRCWEDYGRVDYRKYAEDKHDVAETVRQSVSIYERYL